MQYRDITKQVFVILLIPVSIVSWWYAISLYQANEASITKSLASTVRRIALPYHIAELSQQKATNQLPVPVYNVRLVDISDTWGAARIKGRTHEGVDIFSERWTPVFSATAGYLRRLNIGTRGGKNVMVIGPGGVNYYYAHLDRVARGIEAGVKVTTDTVLGFVGNSGNASGTPPHLHFGIYSEPGNWDAVVNPYPLSACSLDSACRR